MSTEPFDDLELGATLRGFAAGQVLFGRFKLVRTIGRGGMGVVWLAQDEQLEREVALKFLPEMLVSDRTALEDLKRETRRSLSLTHHHIVRIFDFHQQGNVAGISMEYVDGDTLSNVRVEHGVRTFNPGQLVATVKQLCEALDYAHGRAKIVHRDLKPANLMVNRAGELKVTDFGISASITESASRVSMRPSGGTLVYMSPQQLMGEEPCVADDIYSLGATLYDLITGKPPFYQGNIDLQVREKVPPPMAQRREALGNTGEPIPREWEETIAACLAKDSAQRPQNAGEVWERLSGTRQVEAAHVTPVSAPEAAKPEVPRVVHASEPAQKLRNKGLLIAALAVLLLAGGAAAFWFGIEQPKRAKAARIAKAQTDAEQRQREGAEAAEEERARLSKLKAEAEKRQRQEDEAARVVEEARKKKEAEDAAEKERLRLAKEKADADEKQRQMAAEAAAAKAFADWRAEAIRQMRQMAAEAAAAKAPASATKEKPFVNSLGMEFVPVAGTGVLFCRVKTRVKDFGAYAREAGYVQRGGIGVMKVNTNDGSYGLKWGLDAKASWEVPGFAQGPEHPVVGVSWEEANAFCAWLTKHDRAAGVLPAGASYRLPGDEEWSRAVGTGKYPWGNAFPPPRDAGNYGDAAFLKLVSSLSGGAKWSGDLSEVNDGYERTSPAGSFAANRLGIFDLGGNAWEWCRNEYRASMNDADALEKFPLLKVERGSDGTPYRVLRGGSWNLGDEVYLRSSSRSLGRPSGRYDFSGFRCVLVVSGG